MADENKALTPELIMEELKRVTELVQKYVGETSADSLTNSREIKVNLSKDAAAKFDGTTDIETGVIGVLPVAKGGTNKSSWISNGVLYASGTTTISQVTNAAGALYKTSSTGIPTFGTLPIAQGGTGSTSYENGVPVMATSTGFISIGTSSGTGAIYKSSATSNTTMGLLPLTLGGTGAASAAAARINLGLGSLATQDSAFNNNSYGTTNRPIFIDSGTPSGISSLSVSYGGTGKTSWTSSGVLYASGTTTLSQVTNAAGALYKTSSTATPTFGTLPIAQGGTGTTTAASFRFTMGLGNSTAALGIAYGGTGATTAANARSNLGLGTVATVNFPTS